MFNRILFHELVAHLSKKKFTIITGARQTGKSTLLRQLEDHCKQNNLPLVFLNLENSSILSELSQSSLSVLKYVPETEKRVIILIDEVQYLKVAYNFFKLLYDDHAGRIKIVATDSSAFYIDDHHQTNKNFMYNFTCDIMKN